MLLIEVHGYFLTNHVQYIHNRGNAQVQVEVSGHPDDKDLQLAPCS